MTGLRLILSEGGKKMHEWQVAYEGRLIKVEEILKAFIDRQAERCSRIEGQLFLLTEGKLKQQVDKIIDLHIIPRIRAALKNTDLAQETKEVIESILINAKIALTEDKVLLNERMDKIEQLFLDFMYSINHGGVIIRVPD
jgi:uncharacterized membrane protein